jgi:hypothetical protein
MNFVSNVMAVSNRGTMNHTHEFVNFVPHNNDDRSATNPLSSSATPSSNNIATLTASFPGTMDVGTNGNFRWKNVNSTVSIERGRVIVITVDDVATIHHFAGQPIYGIIKSINPCPVEPIADMQFATVCSNNNNNGT